MGIWNNIIQKLDDYFSANENKIINDLKTIIEFNNKTITTFTSTLKERDNMINMLHNSTEELLQEIRELKNNTGFKKLFKEDKTRYKWKPNKLIYLHKSLENFSEDTEYQEKYLGFLKKLGLKDSYKDMDDAVYKIVLLVQKYINKTLSDDYKTDQEVFGTGEYWLSPREAFDQYVINSLASDCEDTSALLYGAIVSGLKYLGYDYTNRLLRVDIDFPVGHAIVAYRKSNGVWSCIESTYGESRFNKNWIRDKDMFKGVYTGLWHIFDEKTEYELIHPYQRK